ncbi:MAG TPA: hypothetical protein VHY75_09600 [Steroidobacteraceae bacterium]|nr:hypothetical protein [Steroidobacteraceae bacterium]
MLKPQDARHRRRSLTASVAVSLGVAAAVAAGGAAGATGVAGVGGVASAGVAPAAPQARGKQLTVAEIVQKNVDARGGLDAWRKVDSMVWTGHMESADPTVPSFTFVLEQKRPNKTHFELSSLGEKSMRVFDGAHGYKLRPSRDGSVDAQPFSENDLRFARDAQGLDGPLIDYQAKGIQVEFAGVEEIEGHKSYRLMVHLPSGDRQDVWIDAKTFLDVKYDRTSYTTAGAKGVVSVFYRNYQTVGGLKIPGMLEIGVGSNKVPDRMVIERIALNPSLDDKAFGRPANAHRRRMATVDIQAPNIDPRNAFGPMHAPGAGGAPVPERGPLTP